MKAADLTTLIRRERKKHTPQIALFPLIVYLKYDKSLSFSLTLESMKFLYMLTVKPLFLQLTLLFHYNRVTLFFILASMPSSSSSMLSSSFLHMPPLLYLLLLLLLPLSLILSSTSAQGPPSPGYYPSSTINSLTFDQGFRNLWGIQHQRLDQGSLTIWLDSDSGFTYLIGSQYMWFLTITDAFFFQKKKNFREWIQVTAIL